MLRMELYVEVTGEGRPETAAFMGLYSLCEQVPRVGEKIVLVEDFHIDTMTDHGAAELASAGMPEWDEGVRWTAVVTEVRHSFVQQTGKDRGNLQQSEVGIYASAQPLILRAEEWRALLDLAESVGWEVS